jgi:putative membrane-bound dehydrogenase-like protein
MSITARLTAAAALSLTASLLCGQAAEEKFEGKEMVTGVAPGLTLTRWAEAPLVKSPVAISIDVHGRAFVTQTIRRRESDPDIREHRDWIPGDLACRSVEDKSNFLKTVLAPEKSYQNLWLTDRNNDGSHDWHDLMQQSELVHVVEDSSGAGKADKSTIFADGFNTEVTGIAAGVLAWHGDVYVTCAPDLWKFRDNAGKSADRKSLVHGFGLHIGLGGHDMHGLTVGPDGKIYWSIGDKAVNVTTPDGRRFMYPYEGCVMRCNPDGSDFEVFAHGLRNPQELAFDEFGNLFSVDNDSDLPGDRERIVYITEQSDSGWRTYWQYREGSYNVWLAEKLYAVAHEGQAAYITPPLEPYSDGPCGFKYNPGTALGPALKNHFFLSQFKGGSAGKSSVTAFKLEPRGAAFGFAGEKLIFGGTLATGLDFGPDGALYICDWVEGWVPHERGGIWRVDDPEAAKNPVRAEVKRLLAGDWSKLPTAELTTLLAHEDMRIRREAQFELVARKAEPELIAATKSNHRLTRVHGIWGLGQLRRTPDAALLADGDAEIVCQTLKVIGDLHTPDRAPEIRKLINHANDRIAFFAAITAGKTHDVAAHGELVKLLEQRGSDPWLRHAAVTGLVNLGDRDGVAKLLEHPARSVRLAAVVALRRLKDARVAAALNDKDETIVTEAARAIHDDWDSIDAALPALASLELTSSRTEPTILRVINANFRLGQPENAQRLMQIATLPGLPGAMRASALSALSLWAEPPVIDRVEGNYRPRKAGDITVVSKLLDSSAKSLLSDAELDVQLATVKCCAAAGYHSVSPAIAAMVVNPKLSTSVRAEALRSLAALKDDALPGAVAGALKSDDSELRSEALRLLAQVDTVGSPETVARLEAVLKKSTKSEKQMALDALGHMTGPHAHSLLSKQMDKLIAGQAYAETALDLLLAAARSNSDEVKAKLAKYEASKSASDPLAAYAECMVGGDKKRGQKTFMEHFAAQCIRCHKVKSVGSDVAPDLTHVATRTKGDRRYLLQSIIDPNAYVVPGYGTVAITLKSGELVPGTLKEESAAVIIVKTPDGQTRTLDPAAIATRTPAVSGMPPMGAILTKQEIRDVIEYLSSLK